MRLQQASVPVRDSVTSVCEMLGYDPLYLACEGRIVAVVDAAEAEALLDSWQRLSEGKDAAIIGDIDGSLQRVVLGTPIGGKRILEELEDDPLPRDC